METIAQVNADSTAWQQLKSGDLAQLNRRLTSAGLQPIMIPTEAALRVAAPEGGVDLP